MTTRPRPRARTRSRGLCGVVVASMVGLGCLAAPALASARTRAPDTPTGLHVVAVSRTSFTVATKTGAEHYRLFAATVHHKLTVADLSAAHKSSMSSKPRVTISGLHYTTAPFFYRVEALNGTHRRFSAIMGTVGLLPTVPTHLTASSTAAGTWLTWNSGGATGYVITQATDPGLTQNVRTYTTEGPDEQFTPYGLVDGTTYYFDVKAMNATTVSAASSVVSATAMSSEQPLRVMTYNLLEAYYDGRREGGDIVSPWSQRRYGVADLIKQADPGVVAIQEGAAWVAAVKGPRQVDDLVKVLGGSYALADTETPPSEKHYFRTGCYILYKTSEYEAVGQGGHWSLGNDRWAAYQILKNVGTGAKFLFVSPHLLVTGGPAGDQKREDETNSLLSQADAYASDAGVPVVFAGDFNSDGSSAHAFDGPSIAMRAADVDDSFDVAQTRTNAQYDSSNEYERTPPAFGERIDYVFAPPGVSVSAWDMVVDTRHGKFVGVIPSDHNPVVADVYLPYQQTDS